MLQQIKSVLLLGGIVILTQACASRKSVMVENRVMDTLKISAASPINFYRETRPLYWDIVHTDVALTFNFKERTANGVADIRIRPYAYPQKQLVLNAKSMDVHAVSEKRVGNVPFKWRNDSLIVDFTQTYHSKDTISLQIKYTARPYASKIGGSKAISQDRGLYFINTDQKHPYKPVQIWTQGETEANSHWLPTQDQPNERFTFTISLTVPDTMTTLSNGVKRSTRGLGNGMKQEVWEMNQPIQPYAMMIAVGKFSVVQDRTAQGKPVDYLVEPEYAPYARGMFRHTPEMIDYFSEVTGIVYPWNKYSQVVVRDYVSGAMENTSASLFGAFINQNFREQQDRNQEDVVSHELFHQWFGDYVTAESWSNLTVNESFATYGEQLWRRYKYGQDACDELALNDLFRYLSSTRNEDPELVRFYYDDKEDMFDRVSYQKGGMILRYMHGLMGDEAFTNAMRIYLTRNALQPAEATDWRKAVEAATGTDWSLFFAQWYERGGHPKLDITYKYNDSAKVLEVTTKQKQDDSNFAYKMPLKAYLLYPADTAYPEQSVQKIATTQTTVYGSKEMPHVKEEVEWLVQKRTSTVSYPYRGDRRPIFVPDSRMWLVGTINDHKSPAHFLVQMDMTGPGTLVHQYNAIEELSGAGNDSLYRAAIAKGLHSRHALIRQEAIERLQRKSGRFWEAPVREELMHLAEHDGNNSVRAEAIRTLSKWKSGGLTDLAQKLVDDSSYYVAGAALRALYRLDTATAVVVARRLATSNPKTSLYDAVWIVLAGEGQKEDYKQLQQEANRAYGRNAMEVAGYIRQFARKQQDTTLFGSMVDKIKMMAMREELRAARLEIARELSALSQALKTEADGTDKEKSTLARQKTEIVKAAQQELLRAEQDDESRKAMQKWMDPR